MSMTLSRPKRRVSFSQDLLEKSEGSDHETEQADDHDAAAEDEVEQNDQTMIIEENNRFELIASDELGPAHQFLRKNKFSHHLQALIKKPNLPE